MKAQEQELRIIPPTDPAASYYAVRINKFTRLIHFWALLFFILLASSIMFLCFTCNHRENEREFYTRLEICLVFMAFAFISWTLTIVNFGRREIVKTLLKIGDKNANSLDS